MRSPCPCARRKNGDRHPFPLFSPMMQALKSHPLIAKKGKRVPVTVFPPAPFSRRLFLSSLAQSALLAPASAVAQTLLALPPAGTVSGPTRVTFTDITSESGLDRAKNVSGAPQNKRFLLEEMGCGVAFIDYDNDGWDDLFVTYWGRNVLYHNNGDGTFTDVSVRAGVAGSADRWGAGCCFLDYDRDGRLDLFVANYVGFDPERAPRPGESAYCRYSNIPVPCGPQGFAGGTNLLYRNRGDGTFEDVSQESGIANPRGPASMVFVGSNWQPRGSYGMGAAAADFDNDGWPDIYVACDSAPSLLYRNNHDGTFREIAVPAGCALDENGVALSRMGVSVADYDGDGWLDIARTNFSEQVTTVYRNYGNGAFEDASIKAGLGINRKYLGFGVGFFDFDNDGWKDLFVANGHVYSQIASRKLHISYRQPKVLYRNLGNGRFEDVSVKAGPALREENLGRGCAFGDFDNDGDVDVIVNNLGGPPTLLRNDDGNKNNWIMIKCVGTKSNRSAIGTRVRVTTGGRSQLDEVMSGSSYYSQNDLRLHFGLGKAAKVDSIEVAWPSGLKESFKSVPANQMVVVQETKGIIDSKKFK